MYIVCLVGIVHWGCFVSTTVTYLVMVNLAIIGNIHVYVTGSVIH